MVNFADRMDGMKVSDIRELLKLTTRPEIISFAGGLPAPELFPKAIIPMHYRDGTRGPRRLEHIDNLINYFEAPEMIHWYNTDTIEITADTEPQVAVLKYMGK